ncbi:MAG: NfeD family protein [Planctomycetales bacterium]
MELSHLAVLLLLVGLGLIVAEIFIPSGGVITAAAVIALAASAICAWQAWWGTSPGAWWAFVGSGLILVPAVLFGALWALPHTSVGRRFLLEAPTPEELRAYGDEEEHLGRLIGATGKTLTLLNPGGLVQVEGERLHCKSEGMLIDPGQPVKVVAVAGNLIVVRPVPAAESQRRGAELSQIDDFLPEGDEPGDAGVFRG